MQEDFLHYIWKHKKFSFQDLKTTQGEPVVIKSTGDHNQDSGPDFFNAQVTIGDVLWAGNLEIHLKSSDWYLHNHETDKAYDNVILHVVWEDDTEIFRKDNSVIPTIVLKNYVSPIAIENYLRLFSKKKTWINCEKDFNTVDNFLLGNWLERLYFERLEQKSKLIKTLLEQSQNDWEAVLFKMLTKNFGLKVNGEAFLSLANSFDFSIVRKLQNNQIQLEALLFGQAGLLSKPFEVLYFSKLLKEYNYLKQKHQLNSIGVLPFKFFRLRPANFPTIRLSQLANLYNQHQNLFSKIVEAQTKMEIYELFSIQTSEFWKNHYTFTKASKTSTKKLSKSFINLILINTIIPLKFTYAKHIGKSIEEELLLLMQSVKGESNSIVKKFNSLRELPKTAMESQALLQLKNVYCDKNLCLKCAVGNYLINEK